jgi:TPR repeat protein
MAVTPTPPATGGKPQTPAPRAAALSKEMIGVLMKRGGEMLAIGDISAARLLYERAAAGGDARAATAAGKTYDPLFLRETAARGVQPQPERAADWYRRALEAGDAEAGARLTALQAATGQ